MYWYEKSHQTINIVGKKTSHDHAEGIEQFVKILERRHNFSKLKEGATYVPAEIAISMKEEARNCEVIGIVDHGITINS